MSKVRLGGLFLLLLCGSLSVIWGASLQRTAASGKLDFKLVYFATRCLLHHCDPYNAIDLERVYQVEEKDRSSDPTIRRVETNIIYLPTIFSVSAPFAILPWPLANLLWMILTIGSFFLAASLIWIFGAKYAPELALFLICFVVGNSQIIFQTENAAGLAVSLCVIAVWCFVQERFVIAGVLCLAVSLAIKPHDGGLVWLLFLLAGAPYRKRALQTLVVAAILSLPAILWTTSVSPHWVQELHSNLVTTAARGDMNDPGPNSVTGRTPNMIISLQTVFSVVKDEPRFYNLATYLVCGPLLLAWAIKAARLRSTPAGIWLALAVIVPLTMLVTYHRPYDAKLLLLTIPACAMLSMEGGPIARWASILSTAAVVFTADIPLGIVVVVAQKLHLNATGFTGKTLTLLLDRPAPLVLLAMAAFYLWVYLRRAPDPPAMLGPHGGVQATGILAPS